MPDSSPLRVTAWIALLAGGIALGATSAFVQANHTQLGAVAVPWGLVLTLMALIAAVRGACWWARMRRAGALVALGWLLPTLALASGGPGGDVVLADSLRSGAYLVLGSLVAGICAVLPLPAGHGGTMVEARGRPERLAIAEELEAGASGVNQGEPATDR